MKVLFIGQKENTSDYLNDYMSDLLLHGLREIYNIEVIDYPGNWYLYKDEAKKRKLDRNLLWGKGFSITNILDNYNKIDRSDILNKIKKNFFDLIIYGSIRRNNEFLDTAKKFNNNIIFIDGEDDQFIDKNYLKDGIYFKRELSQAFDNVLPISFAIPKSKIIKSINTKKKYILSPLIPGKIKTYKYEQEKDYNDMYKKSVFALTYKKAGWDCFRHYEILMNGAIPFFLDLENCPKLTIKNFPKDKILEINKKFEGIFDYYNPFKIFKKKFLNLKNIKNFFTYKFKKIEPIEYYNKNKELLTIQNYLINYTKENLTTEILAKYVLNSYKKAKK